jgi:hypothetical protein
MRSRTISAALGVVTVALGVVILWGMFANPSIDDTSFGEPFTCLAPWDTVLNGADNRPGGSPRDDEAEIGARCRAAGEQRFAIGRGAAIAAVITAGGALAAGAIALRTRPRVGADRRQGSPG